MNLLFQSAFAPTVSEFDLEGECGPKGHFWAYLAHCAVPASLNMVFALVAGVDEAVLALGVQFYQHTQRGPLGAPQGRELPVLVSGQGEEGISAIHEVAAEQGVRVNDGGQRVDDRARMQVDYKEDLQEAVAEGQREWVSPTC